MSTSKASRGIRNNNPGNIDHNPANKWQGELSHDKAIESRFCRFSSPEYGIRALSKILINYQKKHGLDTVRKIINRWAPPVENDTGAYVVQVAKACNVSPDAIISVGQLLPLMVPAIIKHENGSQPYTDSQIADGINMALGLDRR